MVDYSRFDGIGDDSDEEAPSLLPRRPHTPQPPTNVMEDLECAHWLRHPRPVRVGEDGGGESGGEGGGGGFKGWG